MCFYSLKIHLGQCLRWCAYMIFNISVHLSDVCVGLWWESDQIVLNFQNFHEENISREVPSELALQLAQGSIFLSRKTKRKLLISCSVMPSWSYIWNSAAGWHKFIGGQHHWHQAWRGGGGGGGDGGGIYGTRAMLDRWWESHNGTFVFSD